MVGEKSHEIRGLEVQIPALPLITCVTLASHCSFLEFNFLFCKTKGLDWMTSEAPARSVYDPVVL